MAVISQNNFKLKLNLSLEILVKYRAQTKRVALDFYSKHHDLIVLVYFATFFFRVADPV